MAAARLLSLGVFVLHTVLPALSTPPVTNLLVNPSALRSFGASGLRQRVAQLPLMQSWA